MQHITLFIALAVYLLVIGAFLLLWTKKNPSPQEARESDETILQTTRNDLMVVRLLARALMEQEHGKLNFAQIEMIHKIFAKSDHIIRKINHIRNKEQPNGQPLRPMAALERKMAATD